MDLNLHSLNRYSRHNLLSIFQAIYESTGMTYKVGSTKDLTYFACGTSTDWSYGIAKIPYSYMVELRSKRHRFRLPKDQIMETCVEIWNGVKSLMDFVDTHQTVQSSKDDLQQNHGHSEGNSFCIVLLSTFCNVSRVYKDHDFVIFLQLYQINKRFLYKFKFLFHFKSLPKTSRLTIFFTEHCTI